MDPSTSTANRLLGITIVIIIIIIIIIIIVIITTTTIIIIIVLKGYYQNFHKIGSSTDNVYLSTIIIKLLVAHCSSHFRHLGLKASLSGYNKDCGLIYATSRPICDR